MSTSPDLHTDALEASFRCKGEPSIQNALIVASEVLDSYGIHKYGHREILYLSASLTTCDPGDIFETIETLRKRDIRCSVLGLTAEVYVLKKLTERLGGAYKVALSANHFVILTKSFVHSRPIEVAEGEGKHVTTFVPVGFPTRMPPMQYAKNDVDKENADLTVAMCADTQDLKAGGYYCPRCLAVATEVPSICKTCGLQLISYLDLSRTYFNLYPLPRFEEVEMEPSGTRDDGSKIWPACTGCSDPLSPEEGIALKCPGCKNVYCFSCEEFSRTTLRQCPTCPPPNPGDFGVRFSPENITPGDGDTLMQDA